MQRHTIKESFVAKSLSDYIATAVERDLEYRNLCNTCGKPHKPGEPLGPYLVHKEPKPSDVPSEGNAVKQKP